MRAIGHALLLRSRLAQKVFCAGIPAVQQTATFAICVRPIPLASAARRCVVAAGAAFLAASLSYRENGPHALSPDWLAHCSSSDTSPVSPLLDPPPPPSVDDPEENSKILDRWRARIAQARLLWSKLDVAGAEEELRLAIEDAAHFGKKSAPMATSFLNLAQLLRRSGRHAEAEPLLVHAAAVLEENAGPNNKVTLLALIDLAATQFSLGKAQEAATGFEDCLERLSLAEETQTHGREALRDVRAGCLVQAARAQRDTGKLVEAETNLREAVSIVENRWGMDSTRLVAPCSELAQVLWMQGLCREAAAACERALQLTTKPSQRTQLERLHSQIMDATRRE